MEKDVLKKIIIESQEFILSRKVKHRNYTLEENANYVIVGQRRTGKTYFMFCHILDKIDKNQLSIEKVLYVNFEDERLIEFHYNDFDTLLESYRELFNHTPLCFFDEIQNIDGWEKFARRLADQDYRVMITGSNAKMLSKEIATTLGGRFLLQEISGLSFREFLDFNQITLDENFEYKEQRFELQRMFKSYLFYGALPETNKFSNKKEYLSNVFGKILYGDIIGRHSIKNDFGFRLLVKKIAESTMDESSFNRMKHLIKSAGVAIGTQTLIEYFAYLNDSYLVYSLSNFQSKFVERETKKKFYFSDTGILNLFLFEPESKLLETFVFNQLRLRYGSELYYYRNIYEVDFYIPNEELVQVAFSIGNDQTRKRELTALSKAGKNLNCKKLTIITTNEESQFADGENTIKVVPAWKWALLS